MSAREDGRADAQAEEVRLSRVGVAAVDVVTARLDPAPGGLLESRPRRPARFSIIPG
ncbi:hypothetical protein [Streptomyces cuspidosporus]|uniref:hypothetical protein n=1 Tax=Streptomyces cuspidosporus TaxID=66882 RepID=UPI003D15514F